MRIAVRRPGAGDVERFVADQNGAPFSYPHVGATRGLIPVSYTIDHNRVRLGSGLAAFERAAAAVCRWEMFNLGWVSSVPASAPIVEGQTVAVLARAFGLWFLNASRIVYVVDEREPMRRFGFAYGTLDDHAERGEERFTVECREDGDVWYDILAFSRPHHPMVRLAFPLARMLQRRFAADSKQAMVRATLP